MLTSLVERRVAEPATRHMRSVEESVEVCWDLP
jgi:hypothetical protein